MRYVYSLLLGLLLAGSSFGQTLTEVYFPQYMQGAGTFDVADERRVPFACRMTVSGLNPNKTYRYSHGFTGDAGDISTEGTAIFVKQSGDFARVQIPSLSQTDRYGELTTDASGSYTGWFVVEPSVSFYFETGVDIFFRLNLNDGNNGANVVTRLTSTNTVHVINFNSDPGSGTAIRSTPAAGGVAKNFVMLYDDAAPGARPVAGTFIENDGTDNSLANYYADFYANQVNSVNNAWGVIIPNNLTSGIQKIAQYNLANGTEIGNKTSADGFWAQSGGGTVGTANANGGLNTVIVLDGTIITLGAAVQQPQTITFGPLAATTYGDADYSPGATASSSLPVTYSSSNPAVATIENGQIHIVGAGTSDIKAEQAGNVDYSAAAPVTQTLTVNKAGLIITADDKVKVENDPLPVFTVTYAGFVNGDDAGDLNPQPLVNTTATATSPAGTYPIKADGAATANYNISYVDGTLTVTSNKQPQTITFGPLPAKTYGEADFSTGATITSGLPIIYSSSDPAVATIVNGKIHIVGAGNATIKASHPGDANYEPATDVSQLLTVNKAPLTIRADNKTRLVGQPNPPLTITYTGFVNNDTNTVFSVQPVIRTDATVVSGVGNYPIIVEGAAAGNYALTHINGTLTVSPLPAQVITFDVLPVKKYGDAAFAAGATASSGLPVSYSSNNTAVAVIENGTIRVIGAGTVNIIASQPGDAFNAPAPEVVRVLTVQKVNLVIQAKDTSKAEGQANPGLVLNYSGFVNGDDVSRLVTPPAASTVVTTSSVAGRYPIIVSGATSPNYNIAQLNGTLTVLPPQGVSQDNMSAYVSSPGKLQVNIYSVEAGKAAIQLFDQYGTRMLQVNVTLSKGSNTYQLQTGNVVAGVYHVRVAGPGFLLKTKVAIR